MKRILPLGVALLTLMAVSCNSGGGGKITKNYTPEEQQDKLETTTKALTEELDVDKWKSAFEFVRSISEHMEQMADKNAHAFDDIDDWADEVDEAMSNGGTTDAIVSLSALKGGVFEEKDGKLVRSESNKDEVKIVLYPDGKKATVHLTFGAESGPYTAIVDEDEISVKIPSWVNIDFIDGQTTRLSWREDITVVDKNKDKVLDLTEDSVSSSTKITVDDYVLNASKADFDINSSAAITYTLYHGSKMLMSVTASAKIKNDDGEVDVKDTQISLDLMGEVQIKGNADWDKFQTYYDICDNNQDDENTFKTNLEKLNSTFSFALYYDGGSNQQATLSIDPFFVEEDDEWNALAVFTFPDGTSEALAEFLDDLLDSIEDAITKWMEKVQNYFDEFGGAF